MQGDGSVRLNVDVKIAKAEENLNKIIKDIKTAERALEEKKASRDTLANQLNEAAHAANRSLKEVERLKKAYREANGTEKKNIREKLETAKLLLKNDLANASFADKAFQSNEKEIEKETASLEKLKNSAGEEARTLQNLMAVKAAIGAEATKHAIEEAEARRKAEDDEADQKRLEEKAAKREQLAQNLQKALEKIRGTLKGIVSAAGKLIAGAGGVLKGLFSKGKGASDGLRSNLKHLLAYGLGIRSLFALFRRLRSYIKESINLFAESDTETKKNVDSLKASLQTLKASWGAAFAPILSLVTPALNSIINMATRAANAIAALFAALSGKTSFKTATTDANALANATKGAGNAAKEAKKQLMGFDELNILSKDDNSGGGAGGTGTTYQDNEIPLWVKDIKNLINEGEFVELGRVIANGLWNAVNSVDFKALGMRIGGIINAALQFGASFLLAFPWKKLGALIGTFLNYVFGSINFYNLGIILGAKLYTAISFAAGLLKQINFSKVIEDIFTTIHGLLFGIDWPQVASDLCEALKEMLEEATDALQNIDWKEEATQIGNLIKGFIENVDFAGLASDLCDFLIVMFNEGAAILSNLGDQGIGTKLGTFLGDIISKIDWVELGKSLWNLFVEGLNLAADALSALLGNVLGKLWTAFKTAVDSDEDGIITLKEIGQWIWEGITTGIENAVLGVFTWIHEHIFQPFIDGIKSAFGISSPAEEMKPLGGYIGEGLLEGIKNAFVSIGTWINDHIFTPIINAIKAVFGIDESNSTETKTQGESIGGGLLDGISEKFTNIISWIKEKVFDPFINGIKNLFGLNGKEGESKKVGNDAGTSLADDIIEGLGTIGDKLSTWWDEKVKPWFTADKWIQLGKDAVQNIKDGLLTLTMPRFHLSWSTVQAGFHIPILNKDVSFGIPFPDFSWYAKGGIVDGATLIGAGEAGAEAIVPLERNTEWITMVADGLIERLAQQNFVNRLADAFAKIPMPAMASGAVVPPRFAANGFGAQDNETMLRKIDALTAQIEALAAQPIEIMNRMYLDRRQIGESVTEYQRENSRSRGR